MRIVGGLDIHRGQLTFDVLDVATGEVQRGRIAPADRAHLRVWLARFGGVEGVHFAMEGCTGWRYVAEELVRVGAHPHVGEPADTAALKGPKRRAKTDRADAAHLRDLLATGRLPESWIAPDAVLEARAKVRLYKDLADDRVRWIQRVHATLFHLGVPAIAHGLFGPDGAAVLAAADLSPATRHAVSVQLATIEALSAQLAPLRAELIGLSRRHAACRALAASMYGVGWLTAVVIWAEMGDCRRFSSSDDAVRHSGLDITVDASDTHRKRGHLARQGPPVLRWALYEAAKSAARKTSPDHDYYQAVRQRLGAHRATLSVARKLARRAHHILRAAGDDVLAA